MSHSISAPNSFRPVLFPDDEPLDSPRLAQLRADPHTVVLDHSAAFDRQLAALRPPLSPAEAAEPRRWAYFAWRRTLMLLPGPELYRRIRFDRNRYHISTAEQEGFRSARIGIAGLSVGHSIAHTLAMEGLCGMLRLADFDEIELWNLNRLPASVLDLGENKAIVAARRISELDPYLSIEVNTAGVPENGVDEFVDGLDIVVDECDSLDIKILLRIAARKRGIPVVMATSDRGLIDVERFDLEPDAEIFHGLLGRVDAATLRGLSAREKAPYVMRILEPAQLSPRLAASLVETERTVLSWPQLASDVILGAAEVATAVRRILRGEPAPSGRIRLDLDEQLAAVRRPAARPDGSAGAAGAASAGDASGSDASGSDTSDAAGAVPDPDPRPAGRPDTAIEAMVAAAWLAPSGGNSQPWVITPSADRVTIALPGSGRTSSMDIGRRGSAVAIGAAAFNARVAAAAYDAAGPIDVEIDPATGHPTVTVHLGHGTDPELAAEYRPMIDRMSNRTVGVPRPFTDDERRQLHEAAAREGGRLILVTEAAPLAEMADLLAESDRRRYLTPHLHREMLSELVWPGRDSLDRGIDVRTLSLDSIDLIKLDVARRRDVMDHLAQWNLGSALGDPTRDRVRHSSGMAVVTISGDRPTDYVTGGMALERLWVTATRLGLGVYPISPVYLYARNDNDLATLTPDQGEELATMQDQFSRILRIDVGEACVLVLRLVHQPGPAVRSGRRWRRLDAQVELE